ncbi:hypothetical protein AB4Y06_22865 [Streptomyces bobili]|uniref:hypothetical protein n=1 Tax=Streptomyces bobili TaxID=67280 RepID=UPI0034E00AC4
MPIVAWVLMVWAVRRPKIKGPAPVQAALGWVLLAWQPQGGRIGGRAARDRLSRPVLGGFTLEDCSGCTARFPGSAAGPARRSLVQDSPPRGAGSSSSAGACGVGCVQQLLALAGQGGVR